MIVSKAKGSAALLCAAFVLTANSAMGGLTARVVEFRVVDHAFPSEAFEFPPFMGQPGTQLKLLLSSPQKSIVGIDRDRSRISAFKAEDQRSLLEDASASERQNPYGGYHPPIGPFLTFSKDRSQAVVEINAPSAPRRASENVVVEGELVVQIAAGKRPVRLRDVPLTSGPLDVGPLDVAITSAVKKKDWSGEERFTVDIRLNGEASESIESIRFFDANDREVEIEGGSTATMGGIKTMSFPLADELREATIELVFWQGLEQVTVPLELNQSVGL